MTRHCQRQVADAIAPLTYIWRAGGEGPERNLFRSTLKVVYHSPFRKIPGQQSLTRIRQQPVAYINSPPPPILRTMSEYILTSRNTDTEYCLLSQERTKHFSILHLTRCPDPQGPAPRDLRCPCLRHCLQPLLPHPLQFIIHQSSYYSTPYTPCWQRHQINHTCHILKLHAQGLNSGCDTWRGFVVLLRTFENGLDRHCPDCWRYDHLIQHQT